MRIVAVSSRAGSEITEAALWYGPQHAGWGGEFLIKLDQALARLAANPRLFPVVRRAPDVRRVRLDRFPWQRWFYLEGDPIRVFAVLHARRDPREWTERI